jgi:hypothetical protein
MASEKDKAEVKRMIQSLLVTRLGHGIFNSYKKRLSLACARAVIYN